MPILIILILWGPMAISDGLRRSGRHSFLAILLLVLMFIIALGVYQHPHNFPVLAGAYLLYVIVGVHYWLINKSKLSKQ